MNFTCEYAGRAAEIAALFEDVFATSEGADEGALIGRLAHDLLAETGPDDLHVVLATDSGDPIGCILFTRLRFPEDPRTVFLMGPVAVATEWQGRGVGQRLISFGLESLHAHGVDVAVTYGDPAFYGRTGFASVSTDRLAPPMPLSQPEGWLAQSLDGRPLGSFNGPSVCVKAFDDPALW